MKIISILFGKVVSIIKNEGFFSGMAMTFRGLFQISKMMFVKKGEILFVASGASGASTLHRVFHITEELQNQKFQVSVIHQASPFLLQQTKKFQVFIFHHATKTEKLEKFILELEKLNKTIIFETDDLNFDKEIFQKTEAYKNFNTLEKKQYDEGFGDFLLQNSNVKIATTTTTFLAEKLKKYGKQVFIVPNKLSENDLEIAEKVLCKKKKNDENFDKKTTIGYFSGSKSHDQDFATIIQPLIQILKENENVHLYIVGALKLDSVFLKFKNRIVQKSLVSREKFFYEITKCDINLAPLVIKNEFCESKSEIKFFESGILKIPTVASATQTFCEAIQNGKDSFIAFDSKDWYEKLSALIHDKNLREKMGEEAYKTALKNYTTSSKNQNEYYEFLKNAIDEVVEVDLKNLSSKTEIDTAIVVVSWNGKNHLEKCFKSLQKQTDQNFQIFLVDNGSSDNSVDFVKNNFPEISTISLRKNQGFAKANNIGIRMAFLNLNIKYIITLNNDTETDENYIQEIRSAIQKNEKNGVVAIQPKLMNFYDKNKIDSTGILTAFELSAVNRGIGQIDRKQFEKTELVFGPSASASLYSRKILEKLDLSRNEYFDNEYFAYYEDVDLAWRIHLAGFKNMYVPSALVYHVHSATGISYSSFKAFHIYRNHYFNIIKNAPFSQLFKIILFLPIRHFLLVLSVFNKKGASSKLFLKKEDLNSNNLKNKKDSNFIEIVFRAWLEVLIKLPALLKKRKMIQENRKISNQEFKQILRKNKVSIKDVIFKS